MESYLLATKLQIPPENQHTVRRERLVDALEHSVNTYRLTVVAAPAGYGKSTLLAQWAHASSRPVAWLSIDEQDNDLERFLRYLLGAWEKATPGVSESRLGMLLGAPSPDLEATLTEFVNVAASLRNPLAFVLDDFHLIEEPAIHQTLAFLLDHLPRSLHFVVAGRGEPPLPLARYRARNELLDIQAADLQFRQEETSQFLNEIMGLSLNQQGAESLQAQLEGWIAGLQLAALSLRKQSAGNGELSISGKHRFIADYLSEDVLAHLPDAVRAFLLQTNILDRLSGPLCDAVTGRHDSQEMLEAVERENLFLVALDDNREWFRYHRVFADFLRESLLRHYPEQVADLHRRAASWYLAQDVPEAAFEHAMAATDVRLVVQIIDRFANAKLLAGELRVIKHWIDTIPADWYAAYPVLGLARAGYAAYTGDFEACARNVLEVEQLLASSDDEEAGWQMARVSAVRCFMACIQNQLAEAENLADMALRQLPDDDQGFRPGIYAALGDTYRGIGRWNDARQCYLRALQFSNSPAVRVQSAHLHGALADLELMQGRLRQAAAYWHKALEAIRDPENWGRIDIPVTGWVDIRMGELLYEWNQLAEAREHLERGLERAELGGDIRSMIAGYLLAGQLSLVEGDQESAGKYLERARPLVENAHLPEWTGRFERFELALWLASDQLSAAVRHAETILPGDSVESQPDNDAVLLAAVQVLLTQGNGKAIERALAQLTWLLRSAEAEGRMGVVIQALALQALAYWKRGDAATAMTSLERALRLAEPEGYVRVFADLGLSMARLLQEARSRNVMPGYIERILEAFEAGTALAAPQRVALPEPLTIREQEILELVAAGLTNREIADKLVISSETVKKHTGSIYGKLGVSSRVEAAARARELDLLE